VHYYGTKEQWNSITIGAGNSNLTDATLFVAKGSCGENVYWTLEDGTLIIFGTGKMSNYTSSSNPPWSNFIDQVVTINISEGVHNISNRAFATAKNLKTVNIASTVTSIGSYAFANCTELETVNMYGNCSLINIYAFNGCGSLKNINVSGTRNDFDNLTISRGNLNFERASITYSSPEGVIHASMSIYARWFYDENTKELTISNYPYVASKNMLNYSKVESLPWYEFIDEIETIKADGVLSIGSRTAINAPNLHAIEIGETVARINAWAFFGCSSLESIKFPASLKKIGTGAFNGVGSVTSLTYNSNIENYDNILFGNNNTVFERTKVTATDGVRGYHGGNIRWYVTGNTLTFKGKGDMRSISSSTATAWYPYKDTITNIVIDEGINNICSGAFTGFSVTSVEIPSSLRKVGAYAFKDCGNLTQIIYNGTAENFNSISLGGGNVPFKNATIVYEN